MLPCESAAVRGSALETLCLTVLTAGTSYIYEGRYKTNASEGLPERDISSLGWDSLGVVGWGLEMAGNSSVAAQPGMGIGY